VTADPCLTRWGTPAPDWLCHAFPDAWNPWTIALVVALGIALAAVLLAYRRRWKQRGRDELNWWDRSR
jgi:H+/Cl- antiporter ClcA